MDAQSELRTSAQIQDLLDRVEHGEAVVITRDGKPIARMVPMPASFDREKAQAAADDLRELSKGMRLDGISIRALIEEGRRY